MMTIVIAVANQKGGVGKTTVSLNLGFELSRRGYKTLLIDLDPQFNLTSAIVRDENKIDNFELLNVGELLLKSSRFTRDFYNKILYKVSENLHLLPSHQTLSMAEWKLMNSLMREMRLKNVLKLVGPEYDFVIIDNPPSLGIFLVNSLVASDYVLIPTELSKFSIGGIHLLLNVINDVIGLELNEKLKVLGIVPNKFTKQSKVPAERLAELKETYDKIKIFTPLPKTVEVEKKQSAGIIPVVTADDRFGKAFRKFVDEVLKIVL